MSSPQDCPQEKHESDRVRLLVPIIVLVLGSTAIPVELRRFDLTTLSLGCNAPDLVVNWILYLPVGMVLTRRGFWRALMSAALLSLVAETCQFFMVHRYPSPVQGHRIKPAILGRLVKCSFIHWRRT
jgi:hypothetical protein